jgi:hypothetical protein
MSKDSARKKPVPYRKTIKLLLKDLGMEEVDDKIIEAIEKTSLMLNDMKGDAQTIAIRAGCILMFVGVENYKEIQRKLIKGLHNGYIIQERPVIKINFKMYRNLICINLDENGNCRIINDHCDYVEKGHWWLCEIVDNSLIEEIKYLDFD